MAKNLLIGLHVPFSSNKTAYSGSLSGNGSRNSSIGIGPFIRYYLGNSNFKPFAGIGLTYTKSSVRYNNLSGGDYTLKGNTTNWSPSLGIAYFINDNVLLSAGLNYNIYRNKNETLQLTPNPSINTLITHYRNLSFGIGFALLFGE